MIGNSYYRLFSGVVFAFISLAAVPANAGCLTPNNTAIKVSLPDYPFWKSVAEQMKQCGNVEVSFGFDAENVFPNPALPDRDLGALVGVSNTSLARLHAQNLVRPLDDLVEKYRDKLADRQIIRIDGKVAAIAVAGNTNALMVHRDLFLQENIPVPRTYDELIAAAEKLKSNPLFERPLTLPLDSGWTLTQTFIDHFIASDGPLLDEQNQPRIAGPAGISVLERLKRLSVYLGEAFLAEADAGRALDDLLKFRAPMSVMWISSGGPLENPAVSRVAGKMEYLPAPRVVPEGRPAATLWWDGFAIPVSATNQEAEAAFVTALEGLDEEMLAAHQHEAFWLVKAYQPGRLTRQLLEAIDRGLPEYPASVPMALLRGALGPKLEAFMSGEMAAEVALAEAESEYRRAALERQVEGVGN